MITDTAPRSASGRRRRLFLLGLFVPLVLLVSACAASAAPAPDDTPAASLDRFYEQTLAPQSCERTTATDAVVIGECAHVTVPLDYDAPEGATAQVAIFRVAARGGEPIGSLLLNPGGPGYPGVGYAAEAALAWADSAITEQFDLVGFDPRGTGETIPAVDCYTDAEREADALSASNLSLPDTRPLVEACAQSVGGVEALAHLGTRDVARDMDVIRAVLGDEKLTFAGSSYGTRLGAVYGEMFPENVRALVLDGAMDPLTATLERRVDQWEGMQRAFENLAAFCIAQGNCALGDDVEGATTAYQNLVRPLLDAPVPAGDGRELTFVAANDGVVAGLYSSESWPVITLGLAQLAEGRGDYLLAMRDIYHERSADGVYGNAAEATMAINCLDEDRFTADGQTELVEAALAAGPFLDPGTPIEGVPDLCDGWPVEPTLGYPYATDIDGLPATLTVSVTGDALTPHSGGISLAQTLGGSLLTVGGEQHGALLEDGDCIRGAIEAYLIDLEAPAPDMTCRL